VGRRASTRNWWESRYSSKRQLHQCCKRDSTSRTNFSGGSVSPLRCSAASVIFSASRGARSRPRPCKPTATRPTIVAATARMKIMAKTMAVMTVAFRTVKHGAFRGRNCRAGFSIVHTRSSVRHPCALSVWSRFAAALRPDWSPSGNGHGRWHASSKSGIQATDSSSRSREEITADTPSPRMVTP